jgi:hypothetical protein
MINTNTCIQYKKLLNVELDLDLLCLTPLSAIFQLYHGDHGGRSTRKPPTMSKQLVHFITIIVL